MAHARPDRFLTIEDSCALPDDDGKHELQAGMLTSEPVPGMRHGRVAAAVGALLRNHAQRGRLGVVFANDTGYILARSPDTMLAPDVSFVGRERFDVVGDLTGSFPGAPDLAVEVLSPGNTRALIRGKVAAYLVAGTRLVWVVDPESRTVTVHRPLVAPRSVCETGTLKVRTSCRTSASPWASCSRSDGPWYHPGHSRHGG